MRERPTGSFGIVHRLGQGNEYADNVIPADELTSSHKNNLHSRHQDTSKDNLAHVPSFQRTGHHPQMFRDCSFNGSVGSVGGLQVRQR